MYFKNSSYASIYYSEASVVHRTRFAFDEFKTRQVAGLFTGLLDVVFARNLAECGSISLQMKCAFVATILNLLGSVELHR